MIEHLFGREGQPRQESGGDYYSMKKEELMEYVWVLVMKADYQDLKRLYSMLPNSVMDQSDHVSALIQSPSQTLYSEKEIE